MLRFPCDSKITRQHLSTTVHVKIIGMLEFGSISHSVLRRAVSSRIEIKRYESNTREGRTERLCSNQDRSAYPNAPVSEMADAGTVNLVRVTEELGGQDAQTASKANCRMTQKLVAIYSAKDCQYMKSRD